MSERLSSEGTYCVCILTFATTCMSLQYRFSVPFSIILITFYRSTCGSLRPLESESEVSLY